MNAIHTGEPTGDSLAQQIDAWRAHLRASQAIAEADAAELEDHLREQIDTLLDQGLSEDEAFLVAVKRMGAIDALTREFAREHSERLWKQLVLSAEGGTAGAEPPGAFGSPKMWVALGLAVAAAVAIKVPALFGVDFDFETSAYFYPINIGFFFAPFIAAYLAWDRHLSGRTRWALAGALLVTAAIVNAFPFRGWTDGARVPDTLNLTVIHLPIVLWMIVGVAYVGARWRGNQKRMDFLRFTGELFIYYVLIALGGGVLIGLTFGLFGAIGLDMEPYVANWIVPCGAAGAAVVATWLVEAKQSVIENMAPVLARVFVPLFTLALLAFVGTMAATGRGIDVEREILILVDLLLVVVFGLLLYSISARDPLAPAGPLDWIQLTLVGAALLVDGLALWAIGARISEFGFTPNRLAALGMNVVLLVNLAGSAFLYLRYLRRGGSIAPLWEWQMTYLYVLAAWAAVVAFLFPPLFGFA
ncbi:MAG TPA: permease prefix domain 1-containing protein [Gemmatimonadota bacterium]|nr:permease prefix domain 1-containing protein [Gemmatimonadota bacterium]